MKTDVDHPELHELDHRHGDGFDVTLLWSARSGKVYVAVEDARTTTRSASPSSRPTRSTRSTIPMPTAAARPVGRRPPGPSPTRPRSRTAAEDAGATRHHVVDRRC